MVKEARQNTYNRIVEASLILFNTEGERNISTNHIASHLCISPGNLYYHFRNKDEIIMQLFKRYRQELLQLLNQEQSPDGDSNMMQYLVSIFEVMWRYRFFFADVNTLLSRNAELLGEHQEFSWAHVSPLVGGHLRRLVASGWFKMDEESIEACTLNIWLIARYWFVFDNSLHHHQLDEGSKIRGIKQVASLLRPYAVPDYLPQLDAMVAQLGQH